MYRYTISIFVDSPKIVSQLLHFAPIKRPGLQGNSGVNEGKDMYLRGNLNLYIFMWMHPVQRKAWIILCIVI